MQIIARGRVTIYESRGELQLSAEYLEPKGAGALQVAFEQLKAKLAEEGLFDSARKRPMPAMPQRIGIVTFAARCRRAGHAQHPQAPDIKVFTFHSSPAGAGRRRGTEVSAGIRYFNSAAAKSSALLTSSSSPAAVARRRSLGV